jgi:hypothetical protein
LFIFTKAMSIHEAKKVPHVETEKEYHNSRLEKIADDVHTDITFYKGLYTYISRFEFLGPEILDLLVYRDISSGEEIFPTKESALQYIIQKLEKLVRARDAHNCLAQIVLCVEVPVAREDEEEQQEVQEESQHEVISVHSSSSATFDTQ